MTDKVCKLSDNGLEVFPMLPEDVTEADVSGNRILDLDVKGCSNLKILDVSRNLICSIVGTLPITLKTLDIQVNKLKYLDLTGLDNLNELIADHNLLMEVYLPQKIETVSLSVNSLISITIPASVKFINISDNEELSDFTIHPSNESRLTNFSAYNTNLISIDNLPNSVLDIDISRTQIESINKLPTSLKYFTGVSPKLRFIDFANCTQLNCIEVAHGNIQILNMPVSTIISKQYVLIDQDNIPENLASSGETFIPDSNDLGFIDDNTEFTWGNHNENSFETNWGNYNNKTDFDTQTFYNNNAAFTDSFDDLWTKNYKQQTPPESLNKFFKYNLTI